MKYHLGAPLTNTQNLLGWLYLPFYLVLLSLSISYISQLLKMPLSKLGLNVVYFSVNFAVVLLVYHRWLFKSLRAIKEKFWLFVQTLILGFALYYLGGKVLKFTFQLFTQLPINANNELVISLISQNKIAMLLCTVVAAPIVEETLVRGVVFGSFHKFNRYLAYAASILLFSFMHVWQYAGTVSWSATLLNALSYIPAGIALGWTYEKSGTILCPIMLHALINAVAYGVLTLL